MDRRINVASGRSLEQLAHYSRALRVGDVVLQSGTTAIDRQGDVRGVGDVAKQVETIMTIAEWSMGKAGGKLADVVRSRVYVTDVTVATDGARAVARYFRDARPAATLVQVNRLARPEQLVEIELDAVDGAGAAARARSSASKSWAGFARRRSGPRTGGGPRCASTSTRGSAPTGLPERAASGPEAPRSP